MGDIAARISAPVESIQIEVGDHVTKGQVMAVLDAEILQAELNLAQSELDEAGAELKTWAAELDVAKTELRRQEGLRTSVAFSQAKFEDAQKKVVVAEARVERARANVAIKRSNLERKQIDVEYTAVRAPYAGVVMRRYTEVGAYVKKGDPVVRVIGDQSLEVEAFIPTKRLNGLSIGRKVEFKLDDGTRHQARVRSILPSENTQTRTRIVRLVPEFGKTKRPLAESQSVVVNVPISEDRRVVTVHKDAILKRPSGDIVYVVIKDVAQMRTVVLGEALGSRFEVMSGLKEGEVVVIRGNERLQPGTKVRIGKGSS
jgi:RND family efflux transporter MFP subunit